MLMWTYKPGSRGGRALARELGVRRIRHTNSRFRARRRPVVLNWGASTMPDWAANCRRIINHPATVEMVSNKLEFLNHIAEAGHHQLIPPFTDRKEQAETWVRDGRSVVARRILNGHSGRGIVIADREDQLVTAPLYVQYIPKKEEFRIHCGIRENIGALPLDVQRKARRRETPDDQVNWQIRNHDNGFIYMRENIHIPEVVIEAATTVFEASGLDFGAVDVIYNHKEQRAYVLEINCAPGLEGSTLESYANHFRRFQ